MSKKMTAPMKNKDEKFIDIYPTCILADIITVIYFFVTIYFYRTYGDGYGLDEVIFGLGLVAVSVVCTIFAKRRKDKHENKFQGI